VAAEPVSASAEAPATAAEPLNPYDRPLALAEEIELVDWQREALAAWADGGHRGVVEAVTGAGKTPLAFWAIAQALDAEMKVLVIAPSEARAEHWYDGLRGALPINRVGRRTGEKDERLDDCDVVISTAQDAARERMSGVTFEGLIVADQVHAFGTPDLSLALDPRYAWRLGLTAVYERDDNGVATYLDPYFGGASFRLGYERALADGVVSPFDVAVVTAALNNSEQAQYDALGEQASELAAQLTGEFGAPAEPADAFTAAVGELAEGRMGPPRTAARAYQKVVAKQTEIVTKAAAKASVLKTLAERIRDSEPALLFLETQDDAAFVSKVFGSAGCTIRPVSGGQERKLLGRRTDESRDADDIVLIAGARGDTSHVDLGVIVGASRDKLQLVQRLGQVIRDPVGDNARLVAVSVAGTDGGRAAEPVAAATEHAATVARLDAADAAELRAFLAGAPAAEPDTPASTDA
jgi:RNA polymerase primary sigma factor